MTSTVYSYFGIKLKLWVIATGIRGGGVICCGGFFRILMGKLQAQLRTFLSREPQLGQGVYVARGAVVIGDVTLGDASSVWFNAVLRGDINRIVVGHHTNIQDNCVLHLADDHPCVLGDYVTVGHSAIVHACTIGNETLVGMGSRILDGAVVGDQCLIGAGALVTQGVEIPAGSLVLGSPAKRVRSLTPEERASLKGMAEKYVETAAYYLAHAAKEAVPQTA
jgi:carbonic anhydrase/acetyltransferase-like protein (isoleucine patch superfamily)